MIYTSRLEIMDNKYQQISLHIRNEIIALAVDGMKLPSIRELSTHFNVTTITIRKALKVLEEEKSAVPAEHI